MAKDKKSKDPNLIDDGEVMDDHPDRFFLYLFEESSLLLYFIGDAYSFL